MNFLDIFQNMVKVATEQHENPWECLCDICENNLINNLEYARSKILQVSYSSLDEFVNSIAFLLQRIDQNPGPKNNKKYRMEFVREFAILSGIILGNMDIINQHPKLRNVIIKRSKCLCYHENINPKYVPLDILCLVLLDVLSDDNAWE